LQTAIYGAGAFGKIFYNAIEETVDIFIDDFIKQDFYCNTPIKSLAQISKDTKIYISVLQHAKEIEKKLNNDGFTNVINFTDSVLLLPSILKETAKTNYLWLVEDVKSMLDVEKLKLVSEILVDEKSKMLLEKIIALRSTLDVKHYITPTDTEYFPSDIPILQNLNSINFVDCGAYTGDSVEELLKQTINVSSSISFEPDTKNLLSLQSQLQTLKQKYSKTNFLVFPVGIYSSNSILKFSNNGIDSSASFNENSNIDVPVVALDTVLLNSNPNYIKMDIEGAEKEALLGAIQTIQKHKPNLAICLYHKPQDLWELPLLIKEIEPSYDMYIRVHEDMCLSTVLYCISRS
jgi:FkbM family methyltransferase